MKLTRSKKRWWIVVAVLVVANIVMFLLIRNETEYSSFEKELEDWDEETTTQAEKYFLEAEEFFSNKEYKLAANSYRKSIEASFPTMRAYLNLATSLYLDQQLDEAEKVANEGLKFAKGKSQTSKESVDELVKAFENLMNKIKVGKK